MLGELLYEDRKLIDYVDKELSIWPAEDWPYFASFREHGRRMGESFTGLQELKEEAVAYIRENGPVCSDTLPIEGEIYWHSSMHWSGHSVPLQNSMTVHLLFREKTGEHSRH